MKIYYYFSVIGLFIIFFPGCAYYMARPLHEFTPMVKCIDGVKKRKPLLFEYQAFTAEDCKKYFDRNLLKKDIQPIFIRFTNNTKHYFKITRDSFNVPTMTAESVAQQVYTSTLARAICYGVGGIFAWPFFIPAVADSLCSSQSNLKLDLDFVQKELTEHFVGPYEALTRVIFVHVQSFRSDLTLTLVDAETGEPCMIQPADRWS